MRWRSKGASGSPAAACAFYEINRTLALCSAFPATFTEPRDPLADRKMRRLLAKSPRHCLTPTLLVHQRDERLMTPIELAAAIDEAPRASTISGRRATAPR